MAVWREMVGGRVWEGLDGEGVSSWSAFLHWKHHLSPHEPDSYSTHTVDGVMRVKHTFSKVVEPNQYSGTSLHGHSSITAICYITADSPGPDLTYKNISTTATSV